MTTTPTLPLPEPEHRCGIDLYYKIETVSAIQDAAYRAGKNAGLEEAAVAITDHWREGREWIPGSLWGTLTSEAAGRVRALKAGTPP